MGSAVQLEVELNNFIVISLVQPERRAEEVDRRNCRCRFIKGKHKVLM